MTVLPVVAFVDNQNSPAHVNQTSWQSGLRDHDGPGYLLKETGRQQMIDRWRPGWLGG
jgi:hypothetical protein